MTDKIDFFLSQILTKYYCGKCGTYSAIKPKCRWCKMKATKHRKDELVIVNIYPPDNYNAEDYGGETWANQVCSGAPTPNAPDYDGTTGGNPRGINVLVLKNHLRWWEDSAKELGCSLVSGKIHLGHCRDGHWEGTDIVEVPNSNTEVFWIW